MGEQQEARVFCPCLLKLNAFPRFDDIVEPARRRYIIMQFRHGVKISHDKDRIAGADVTALTKVIEARKSLEALRKIPISLETQ